MGVADMLKVIDIFPIGNQLSVTLDGVCDRIKNGCKLIDSRGSAIQVISVGMVRYTDHNEIGKTTTLLVDKCDLSIGAELTIA
jgi:hypothetical protein